MRYKQIYKPLQLAICATLICASFTACSNSETDDISLSTEQNKVPLSVSAIIQSGDNSRKASLDAETFEVGDTIGLFILDSSNSAYNESTDSYNLPAVFNGTDFDLTQDVYLTDEKAYVYAYYPYTYSDDATNGVEMEVYSGDVDVLTAESPSTATRDNPQATLTFCHALSRITLSLKVSEEMDGAAITSVKISSENSDLVHYVYFFNSLSIAEDTWSFSVECSETLSSTETTDIDILLYPASAEDKTASIVVDDTTYEFEFPTSLTDSWEAGCQYTYPITITTSTATEDDSTDDDTSDDNETTDSETTEDTIDYNGYEAVDLGLSVKWATMNVGAESPEDYGNYYAWGEIETKSTYTSSNSVTYGVDMDDISGNAEYDAATANWGGSWRIPTSDELNELVDECTWEWTTLNDINGYLVTGENDNSIFLPAAGCRYGSSLNHVGSDGYYLSSTPFGSTTYYAYDLYFCSSYQSVYYYLSRYHGRSVRPVTN